MIEISDFVSHGPVQPEVIEAYRGRVPADVIELWETYGYGTFASGFLRVIDPAVYETELADCIGKTQGDGIAIPVMVTGLADLITWEPSVGFVGIMYREGRASGLNSELSGFLEMLNIARDFYLSRTLNWDIFPKAVEMHGELPYDQSFTFVPLRSLGGPEKVENLKKRETIAAIQVMVEFQGVIGH
ncbi:T6SS immunity protein Tdi1 domain-containing protein [Microbacterium sp. NPDC056234]|uniref:T6SS immunity protein Tdi1 domain-containing protein n=1 Tax=Microbacterium sp. NPDC056234 TaxID=3345757 RepID=UPI0035E33D36